MQNTFTIHKFLCKVWALLQYERDINSVSQKQGLTNANIILP